MIIETELQIINVVTSMCMTVNAIFDPSHRICRSIFTTVALALTFSKLYHNDKKWHALIQQEHTGTSKLQPSSHTLTY